MNFGDLIQSAVTTVGGGLRGQNEGDDVLYQRRQQEDAAAEARSHYNTAEALRRYSAQHQASSDDARTAYYNQRLLTMQQPKPPGSLAPKPGTPEWNASALSLYGGKKAIDAKYKNHFPSFSEVDGRRKQAEHDQAEEDQGNALMASFQKPRDVQQPSPDGKGMVSVTQHDPRWQPFWSAFQAIQARDPSLSTGRVALRAWKALSGANTAFHKPTDAAPVDEAPQAPPPEPDDGFFSHLMDAGKQWWNSGGEQEGDGDAGDEGALDHTPHPSSDVESQRAEWDNLARVYGQDLTEQQVGPRP